MGLGPEGGALIMAEVHGELSFWRKYIFLICHKVIGIQYGITALLFLLFVCILMIIEAMRQLLFNIKHNKAIQQGRGKKRRSC